MALVPQAEAERLYRLALPDSALWDELHELDGALERHDRPRAAAIVAGLQAQAPDHFLTLHARRRLAMYDANPHEELAAVDALCQRFPENAAIQLIRLDLLRHLERRDLRLATLEQLLAQPEAEPEFLVNLAEELAADAREHDRAMGLLRTAIRKLAGHARPYFALANILWDRLQFDEALELYRFAACLSDKEERVAEAYFHAALACRATETVLGWLRNRFRRFGAKSHLPAQTLVWALGNLERTGEALAVLEEALRLRPDDGELRLLAAEVYTTASGEHLDRAQQLLEEARDRCPRASWLCVAANMARSQGKLEEALARFQEVLELRPLDMAAHRAVARLLAETENRQAALDHLRAAAERFPHYQPLLELWVEWLRAEPAEVRLPVLQRLIDLNPADAWSHRELGFLLAEEGRLEEAEKCADRAGQLDPYHPAWYHLRGRIYEARGQFGKARAEYRQAIRLSVDDDYAIQRLLECCDTLPQRRRALEFVHQELIRQVVYGAGLLAYRNFAHGVLEPEALLASLREALAARPDLWHAWSACVQQLVAMERFEEAERLARQACERFPLLVAVWLDLARVYEAIGKPDEQLEALGTAHRIDPTSSEATRCLAELYQRRGELEQARTLLESAISRDPLDAANRVWLAEVLWQQGKRDAALGQLERAIELEPGYEWAWAHLSLWSAEAQQPDRPVQAARRLVEHEPGEARSWLILAKVLGGEHLEECLSALRKAAELNPRLVDAYEQQARVLAEAGRYDEALAACSPAHVWPDELPAELMARAAWVEWSRGNRDEAMGRLRQALEADPSMPLGWEFLTEWSDQLGDTAQYLEASRQWMRLVPDSATAWGCYAEASLKTGNRSEAKRAFRRALEIRPQYLFAGIGLVDLQLEDGELEQAGQTLEMLRACASGPLVLSRSVQWAARRNDFAAASQWLSQLCSDPGEDEWPLCDAIAAMGEAKWTAQAAEILDSALCGENVAPQVGLLWGRCQAALGRLPKRDRFLGLMEKGPVGERAVYGYIEGLIAAPRARKLRRFIRTNADWLRSNTETWGAVGYAWTSLRDWPKAFAWMQHWRDYPEAKPWMLVNVAEAFRAMRKDQEAAEISRHALALPEGPGQEVHRLWLASDGVIAGQYSEASALLEPVDPEELDEDYAFLYTLVRANLEITQAAPHERRAAFRRIRAMIDEVAGTYPRFSTEPARRRYYLFTLKHVAHWTGTFGAYVWALWRRLTR